MKQEARVGHPPNGNASYQRGLMTPGKDPDEP